MKYARVVDGRTVDIIDPSVYNPRPSWGQTDHELLDRTHGAVGGFAAFVIVPDDTLNGAHDNGDGTYTNPPVIIPHPPQPNIPNIPNNPYFGKKPIATKDFWALIGQVLSAARFKRLTTDSHFLWIDKVLDKVEIVDVDDKAGQFLQIVQYLTTTTGDDGSLLVETSELQAIMKAWG